MQEAKRYIQNIRAKYGSFEYAAVKTVFEPALLNKCIERMIPSIIEYRRSAVVHRSTYSINDVPIDLDTDDEDGVSEDALKFDESTPSNDPEESGRTEKQLCIDDKPFISLEPIDKSSPLLETTPAKKRPNMKRASNVIDPMDKPAKKKVRFSDDHGQKLTEVFAILQDENEQTQFISHQNDDKNPEITQQTNESWQNYECVAQQSIEQWTDDTYQHSNDQQKVQEIARSVYSSVSQLLLHRNNANIEALSNEITSLKNEMTRLKNEHHQTIEELKNESLQLEVGILERDLNIDQMQNEINEVQEKYAEKLNENAEFQQKMERKCLDNIRQIKKDAEENRIKCKGCKALLQGNVYCGVQHFIFCGEICAKMW